MKYYLAIDIGASSGRHIVGWCEDDKIKTKEVYRFPNGVTKKNGHLVWNIDGLVDSIIAGIGEAFRIYPEIESLSIDTWGVDYVLLDGDKEIYPVYAYRDGRTEAVIPKIHEIIPFSELYSKVGCQFQPFNSIYQLYDDKLNGRLDKATDMLMIPEYLMWKLCGVMITATFLMCIPPKMNSSESISIKTGQSYRYLIELPRRSAASFPVPMWYSFV